MRREIKFRAWDGKKMHLHDWRDNESQVHDLWQFVVAVPTEAILMQYTGLKDKNGKEIYESDIVSHWKRLYEVAINFNGYYLQRYKLWRGKFVPSFQYSMSLITKPIKGDRGEKGGIVDEAEVIGNVYENPELVKTIKATFSGERSHEKQKLGTKKIKHK